MARKHRPLKLKPKCKLVEGHEEWSVLGMYHRENGLPAIVYPDGTEFYLEHNKYHRENGPAVIMYSSVDSRFVDREYYLLGVKQKKFV